MMKNINNDAINVQLKLSVTVEYEVLNKVLRQKFQGKILSKGKENGETSDRARILEIFLEPNVKDDFPISLHLKIKLLTTFFSGKEVEMLVHLAPEFNAENQEISVTKYKIDGLNNGWIINNLLESLVNSFLYSNLRNKMKFNLQSLLQTKVAGLNAKLHSGMEVKSGIFLSGALKELQIEEIRFQEGALQAFIAVTGKNKINIADINF